MKILATGLNGLVGSRITQLLGSKYEFETISRTEGVDVTNASQLTQKVSSSEANIVIHMAAKTAVDGCEKDKEIDTLVQSGKVSEQEIIQKQTAWAVNVLGTKNIADACAASSKKLIYISTDFVFDGKIGDDEFYHEGDVPNPVNWYAQTKYEGEKIVQALSTPWMIMRLAYPYRGDFTKNDFFRAMKNRLANGQPIAGVADHIFAPTFIDDFATILDTLIDGDEVGIYHTVGEEFLSPYDAALIIAEEFGYDKSLISRATRAEYFLGKAERPFRLALKNDKINALGFHMRGFREGLQEIKKQLVHS